MVLRGKKGFHTLRGLAPLFSTTVIMVQKSLFFFFFCSDDTKSTKTKAFSDSRRYDEDLHLLTCLSLHGEFEKHAGWYIRHAKLHVGLIECMGVSCMCVVQLDIGIVPNLDQD